MLLLGVIGLLAASVAALPCWGYSRNWGYVPSTVAGILLFFAALVAVGGKPAQSETAAEMVASAPPPAVEKIAPKRSSYVLDSSRPPIPLLRASARDASEDADTRTASQ